MLPYPSFYNKLSYRILTPHFTRQFQNQECKIINYGINLKLLGLQRIQSTTSLISDHGLLYQNMTPFDLLSRHLFVAAYSAPSLCPNSRIVLRFK